MANTDHNPSGGIQGSSPLYRFGTSPNTRSVVSQKIRVLAPAFGGDPLLHQIGVLANFTPGGGDRGVEEVRGIGFGDQIAEIVPGPSAVITADVERQLLYLSNLWQSTGYAAGVSGPMRALKHHRWPFDIRTEIVFSTIADVEFSGGLTPTPGSGPTAGISTLEYGGAIGGGSVPGASGAHNILVTYYETCWWTSWSTSGFGRDSSLITESGSLSATDVHDGTSLIGEFFAGGNDPTKGEYGTIRYRGLGG